MSTAISGPSYEVMAQHQARVQLLIADRITEGAFVVEVGPGGHPFGRANVAVDMSLPRSRYIDDYSGYIECDVSTQPLPFDDKEVDFLYCRHTLEDLDESRFFLSEVSRVAKAGYIETPSPLMELCRRVDGGAEWRGFRHHRHVVWEHEGTLWLLPKLPMVEHITFGGLDEKSPQVTPWSCNTYYLWTGEPVVGHIRPYVDTPEDYRDILVRAVNEGQLSSKGFSERFG